MTRTDPLSADDALRAAFSDADPGHFAWQTGHPYVSAAERALVETAYLPLGKRLLDVGGGEGATLLHLGSPPGAVSFDLFPEKVRFARSRIAGARWLVASALQLPFRSGAFDHVIVRDLIHHIEEPGPFIAEAARVLEPGGRLDILEPCGRNPLIALHAWSRPEERGELRSTAKFLRTLAGSRFRVDALTPLQPLPLHRLLFHPTIGLPSLGRTAAGRGMVHALETIGGWLLPRSRWAYLHLRAVKT